MIVDGFAPEARALRQHFDTRFAEPRRADAGRFVWDYWHVPGQYSHLRTPAWEYFPKKVYASVHNRLVAWGRQHLGCHDISPPWLSCYIDGSGQELHGDLPHGHFAWVLSLTQWEQRTFQGGETMLLREEVLDYWRRFTSVRGVEKDEVIALVPPLFNRLFVFDPRVPHGVAQVRGSRDPREGRLVMHGWFVQPRPFIAGPLSEQALSEAIETLTAHIGRTLSLDLAGLVSVRFSVGKNGRVGAVKLLADTTRAPGEQSAARVRFVRALLRQIRDLRFRAQRGVSRVTLPLVFERA